MIIFMSCSLDKWYIFLNLFRKSFHTSSLHFSLGSLSEQSCIGIESGRCSWGVRWWSWWWWEREWFWSWPGQNWTIQSSLLLQSFLRVSSLLRPSASRPPCPGERTAWPDGFILVIIIFGFINFVDVLKGTSCNNRRFKKSWYYQHSSLVENA